MAYRRGDYFVKPCDLLYDDDVQIGDIIQIKRSLKQTVWAVYDGEGEFICVRESVDVGRKGATSCSIEQLPISAFTDPHDMCRVNNYVDKYLPAFDSKTVVERAQKLCGTAWEFNASTNNTEHFATLCRYGIALSLESGQVNFGSLNETTNTSINQLPWFEAAQIASRQESLSAFGMSRPRSPTSSSCRCI